MPAHRGPTRRDALAALLVLTAAACRRGADRVAPDVLGTLPPFAFEDQHGRPLTSDGLRGHVWVAAFFFTRCPTVCPRLVGAVRELQAAAKRDGIPVRFVAFTVDPEHDTPAVLARYAADQRIDLSTWSLARGPLEAVKKTSVDGFKVALEGQADAAADHLGILHGSHLVLVDRQLRLRGYYRSLDADVAQKLLPDAARLAAE